MLTSLSIDIGDDHVRVVLDASRVATAAAPAPDSLYQKMLALDTALFDSFNRCSDPAQLEKHAAFFAKEVEFYHDLGGCNARHRCVDGSNAKERMWKVSA